MYRAKIDNSEFSLPTISMCYRKIPAYHFSPAHKAIITRNSRKCSELLLWQDAQSFDMWGIPPRLTVLFLTQKYQTYQNDFNSKMPDRCLHVYNSVIKSSYTAIKI